MPISIEQYKDQDLTVIVAAGDILDGEPFAAQRDFYDGEPTAKVLWDFRAVSGGQLSADEIRQIFDYAIVNMPKRQSGKTAFVAPEDHEFGLARMTTTIGELRDVPWELRAFRNLADAVRWLGVQYVQE